MENVYLALIVAIPAMLSPLLMAWLTNRNRAQEKREDYARQDAVAERVAEAAKLLLASTERVAQSAVVTNSKLDVIHTLVNSNMTAAMQAELDARVIGLAQMIEIIELKKAAGKEPTKEALGAVASGKAKIAELEATLADRLTAQKAADKRQDAAAGVSKEMKVEMVVRPQP